MTKQSLKGAAIAVLLATDPTAKANAVDAAILALNAGADAFGDDAGCVPETPGRPAQPVLVDPTKTPRRRLGGVEGRAALMHAIAHIEFNAINLAFDMAARFVHEIDALGLNRAQFMEDWFSVGDDEARHFGMIADRLREMDCEYGDFSAHNGLWDAASATAGNLLARLVVAPLILEARGLDVTPGLIERLKSNGDHQSADILAIIVDEEVAHVACGKRWFDEVCQAKGLQPLETFKNLEREYFKGQQKPPFNHIARKKAGLDSDFYERK